MKNILFLCFILTACLSKGESNQLEKLSDYEGKYEYTAGSTLILQASELNTTLYAIINNAKYPLSYIAFDSFTNTQDIPVTFQRDSNNKVISYKTNGQTFQLLSKDFKRFEFYPRKKLYKNPDDYAYHPPIKTADGLEVGTIQNVFKKPEMIINMVKETIKGDYPDVHSILIYKDDKLVLEEYFYGYDINTPHQIRSATKPLMGALVGIAIQQGAIGSQDDKLLPYFKSSYQEIKNLDKRKQQITIADFLRYQSGMDCENNNPESKGNEQRMMESEDWVKYTLDLPMVGEPGEVSSYCTGCALTLGSLIELTTDMPIEDFAKKNLFDPMGITNYLWSFAPDKSSLNTFSQMSIRPRDLVKLAKMFKDGGNWQGKTIVPKSWVEKTFDTENGDYGYLWYNKYLMVNGKRYDSYMASGNGGQKINIWPQLNMITVFTGGNYNSYELYGKSTPPNEMIPNYILKALE